MRVPREVKRALDPIGQGKFWWYCLGTIPAAALSVALRAGTAYQPVADLEALLNRVVVARVRAEA